MFLIHGLAQRKRMGQFVAIVLVLFVAVTPHAVAQVKVPAPKARHLVGTERGAVPDLTAFAYSAHHAGVVTLSDTAQVAQLIRASGTTTWRKPEGYIDNSRRLHLLAGGAEMLCCAETATIRTTDTFAVVAQLKDEPKAWRLAYTGAAEARIAFLGYQDGALLCWDRGRWFGPQVLSARVPHPVVGLSANADGSVVAVVCQPKGEEKNRPPRKVYLWRPRSDKAPLEYGDIENDYEVSLSPSGTRLALIEFVGSGRIEEVEGKKVLANFERGGEQMCRLAIWADEQNLVCLVWDRGSEPDLRLHLGLLHADTQEWLWRVPVRAVDSLTNNAASVCRRSGKVVYASEGRIEVFALATGEREPGWAGNDNLRAPLTLTDTAAFGWKPGEETLQRWDYGTNRRRPVPGFDTDPTRYPNLILSDCGKWAALVDYPVEDDEVQTRTRIRVGPLDPADGTGWERVIKGPLPVQLHRILRLARGGASFYALTYRPEGLTGRKLIECFTRDRAEPEPVIGKLQFPSGDDRSIGMSPGFERVCFTVIDPAGEGKMLHERTASLRIWSRKEQREIGRIEGVPANISSVFLSERKDLLWVDVGDRELRCYDQRTGALCWKRDHSSNWNSQPPILARLSPDEHLFFVRDEVLESTTGVPLLDALHLNGHLAHGTFASAGRCLLLARKDGCVGEFDWPSALLAASAVKELHLGKCMDRLGEPTRDGYAALVRLRQSPREALALLRTEKPQPLIPQGKSLAQLIADLGADDFEVRSRSQELLTAIAPVVQTELQAALAKATDAQLRKSLEEILAANGGLYKSREGLRAQRVVHLLEGFSREDAIPILSGFVREQPISYLAAFARQSLRQVGQTVP